MVARSWAERLMQEIYEDEGYDVISVGAPDFILLKQNRIQFIEIKTGNDRPSEAQKRAIRLLNKHGFKAQSELIQCVRDPYNPGYHTIKAWGKGAGNVKSFQRLSEWVKRIRGK